MGKISELHPREVFSRFEEICNIPHGSGNTAAISDYLVRFAAEHGLKYRQEPCGNVIIWKDATPGYESADSVMLQGHMDMVAVKTEECGPGLDAEHIRPTVSKDGEWVYAKGTSLGGDDGIALAMTLAILEDDTLKHPALEAVFTVDEEIGLLGATALDASDLKSKILLNMDSEEDGVFLTSCAGGATVKCSFAADLETCVGSVFEIKISGLIGGHSGSDAHLERGNANVLMGRFLAETYDLVDFKILDIKGGTVDNAIPTEACVHLLVSKWDEDELDRVAQRFFDEIIKEYETNEPDIELSFGGVFDDEVEIRAIDGDCSLAIIRALELLPAGIQRWMPEIPDMVQTSLNLGVVDTDAGEVSLTYLVRSSSATEKEWLIKRITDLAEMLGGSVTVEGAYPAWEYVPGSRIQKLMSETYEELTGKKPRLSGIHAGVECGILAEKLPGLDAISYGPLICDIHTTRERLNIASVARTYELTRRVLEKLV